MQLVRRYRIPALFCALAVLLCVLISRPYAEMGICDDGPYTLIAKNLAATGHIAYNGWPAAMLGWQLYLGAAFIKLFGFSFTTVRMSTVLVAMATVFFLQRTMVRVGITERNATLGTLVLALSPLYLLLSVTYMSDITGLFAVVVCLYCCLRALQSSTDRAAIAWLCLAVFSNALCGTSRQIAWLGILAIVPSALWLLRARRRVLLAGAAATLVGIFYIFACIQWLKLQPYVQPERLLPASFPVLHMIKQLSKLLLEAPFLILPIVALFLPQIRRIPKPVFGVICLLLLGYSFLAWYPSPVRVYFLLEPATSSPAGMVGVHGIYEGISLAGDPPLVLTKGSQILLTIVTLGGVMGIVAALLHCRKETALAPSTLGISLKHLGLLLAPFTIIYFVVLIPRSTGWLYDRYLLTILVVALLSLIRYYQDQIDPQLPVVAGTLLILVLAVYGVSDVHNLFSLYRARTAIAAELNAKGVPDTSVDNGWEFNLDVELQHAPSINYPTIAVPAHAYVPVPLPTGICTMPFYEYTPHIHPLYRISFDPNACYGPTDFAPVHYSRWLASKPGTLYVVRYTP